MNDRDTMARLAANGDSRALEALLRSLEPDIAKAVRSLGRTYAHIEADDLQQMAYEVTMKLLGSWEPAKSPFEAFFRLSLKRELKWQVLGDNGPIAMPPKVAGALRTYRAKVNADEHVDLAKIAKTWQLDEDLLAQAITICDNPGDAYLAMGEASFGASELAELVAQETYLDHADRQVLLGMRAYGLQGLAMVLGVSPRTARRRFEAVCDKIIRERQKAA